jgi:hypothetical protein
MTVLGFDLHTTIVNSPAVFNGRLVQTLDYECDWEADTLRGRLRRCGLWKRVEE